MLASHCETRLDLMLNHSNNIWKVSVTFFCLWRTTTDVTKKVQQGPQPALVHQQRDHYREHTTNMVTRSLNTSHLRPKLKPARIHTVSHQLHSSQQEDGAEKDACHSRTEQQHTQNMLVCYHLGENVSPSEVLQ